MKGKWKVSVLTPVHQTPVNLLKRAYHSLEKQSLGFSSIQWVVVLHNCEPDYIMSVQELFGAQPNIRVSIVNQEDTGVSFARNATLDLAEGEYLFFLDSDDEMKPDCIETVLQKMEESRSDTAIYTATVSGGGGLRTYYTDADPDFGAYVFERGDPRISKSMCISGMTLWTRCYRRDLVQREGVRFDESLDFGEDFMFNIQLTGRAERVLVLPQLTGYVYYAGIGMTDSIMMTVKSFHFREKQVWEDVEASLWGNEGTALYLRSVWREGRKCGLDLDCVMWLLLSQFGRLYLFSDMPKAMKDNFLVTLQPLVKKLHPPVMEWKEKQAEADNCFAFVKAMTQVPLPEPVVRPEGKRPVIFVFVNPAWGHVTPLLGVMRALAERGFHVRVFSGQEHAERIRETGAVYVSCDDIYEEIDLSEREALGLFKWIEYARRLDPVIGREIRKWQPCLALVDASTVWGRLLAQKYRLPVVLSSATMLMSYRTYSYWRPLMEKLGPHMEQVNLKLSELQKEGFPANDLVGLYLIREGDPCITYTSRLLQPKSELFSDDAVCFTGYSRYLEPACREEQPRRRRPLVYVTLGTVSSINVWFFRSCAIAFRDMDIDVEMVIWKYVSIDQLGEIPPNVRIRISVDQEKILRKADAVVFHAGLNTMTDSLMLGVPMVAYPSFGEQHGNARRIEELGCGIVIDNYRPDTVRQAVRAVLSEDRYRNRAREIGEDMRRYPGAAGAADWILGRIKERGVDMAGHQQVRPGFHIIGSSVYSYLYSRKTMITSDPGTTPGYRYEIVPVCLKITMQDSVNMALLQRCVDDTASRFPLIKQAVVRTENGFFLAERKERIPVRLMSDLPQDGSRNTTDCRNLLVYASDHTILLIADHAQMDGYGLLEVTRYLLDRYFSEEKKHSPEEAVAQMKDPMRLDTDSEWDPLPELSGRPWRIPFEEGNVLTELSTQTEPVLRLCKKLHTSAGILFMVLIFEALRRLYPQSRERKVTAALPADFREVLGCDHTLKNCSWPVFFEMNSAELADASLEERAGVFRAHLNEQRSERKAKSWIHYYKALARIASERGGMTGQPGAGADLPYTFLLSYLRLNPQEKWKEATFFYDFDNSPETFTMLEYNGSFHLWMARMKQGEAGRRPEQALEEVFTQAGLSVHLSDRKRRNLHFTIPTEGDR